VRSWSWLAPFLVGDGFGIGLRFGPLFDADQLVTPVALEGLGPLVDRLDRFGVGAVKAMAAVAPHADQAHFAQHAEVLGNGRLIKSDGCDDLADLALCVGQIKQNLPPPWLSDGVKWIGSGSGPCHDQNNTFPYKNMSSEFSLEVLSSEMNIRRRCC